MNKALFLDRDGVINIDKGYVYRIEDFEFVDGIFDVLKHFQNLGYLLIIITNQAGIGRGYYTEFDFHKLNDWMVNQFKKHGVTITAVYFCPYHPTHGIGKYKKDAYCRKPNPGMIKKAQFEFNIDLSRSLLIGDKVSDVISGERAGVKSNILLSTDTMNKYKHGCRIIKSLQDILTKKVFDNCKHT